MDYEINNISSNFLTFVTSFISLSIIASIFSYRLLNSFFDNIFFPILDLFILPDKKFHKLTKIYDINLTIEDKIESRSSLSGNESLGTIQYAIRTGIFLKDFITWSFMIIILYIIYRFTN